MMGLRRMMMAGGGMGAVTLRDAILSYSPLGYWRLDETSGNVAVDISGHGRHGAYVGGPTLGEPPIFAGADGSCALGASSYVTIPSSSLVAGNAARSFGMCVNVSEATAITLLGGWGEATAGRGWCIERGGNASGGFTDGAVGINAHGFGYRYVTATGGIFPAAVPVFVVATYDGAGSGAVYINGEKVLSATLLSLNTAATNGAIGRRTYSTALAQGGRYSDVFIVGRALSEPEVAEVWAARNSR